MPDTPQHETVTLLGWAQLPRRVTPAALDFFREYLSVSEYVVGFGVATVLARGSADRFYEQIVNEQVSGDISADEQILADFVAAHGKAGFKALVSSGYHGQLLFETVLCRMADNYLSYLSDLLALIFRTRRETLRSGEQERLDFILQFQTMDDLVAALTEKRVEELAYQGMRDLTKYVKEKLGLPLFVDEETFEGVARLVEERNVIVHNRGIVSKTLKKRLPAYPLEAGQRLQIDLAATVRARNLLGEAVSDLDARAVTKFKLPQVETEALEQDFAARWSPRDTPSA